MSAKKVLIVEDEAPNLKLLVNKIKNLGYTTLTARDGTAALDLIKKENPNLIILDVILEKTVDRSKTEFVSLASHQLRTPLSAINWYGEMLLAGDVGKMTSDQRKYVEEIYAGSQRMTSLVGSLLNVSRIELGTFLVDPALTDVIKLVKAMVSKLKPQITALSHKFEEHYDAKLPLLNVDSKVTQIIIENLITNAVKYTPRGGRISLTVKKEAPNIIISVTDNGYGIPKNQQDKVFGKLFRADNIVSKDTEGTGLGLYLVKSIVDLIGGKIGFVSKENKGTTFNVQLPLTGMKQIVVSTAKVDKK